MSIVHFIGAGPGDPDLITVKGTPPHRTGAGGAVCRLAGAARASSIWRARTPASSTRRRCISMRSWPRCNAPMRPGHDVARVHSGDPSIYGAIGEQMRRLDALGIPYDVIPGVPAFAAAAALLKTELTLPGISQSIVISRVQGSSSPMPPREDLATLGAAGATLALHLSVKSMAKVVRELTPHYGADCPVRRGLPRLLAG